MERVGPPSGKARLGRKEYQTHDFERLSHVPWECKYHVVFNKGSALKLLRRKYGDDSVKFISQPAAISSGSNPCQAIRAVPRVMQVERNRCGS